MRWFAILLVGLVFGAMLLFDTAALVRLGWLCLSGGCGASPLSIAVGTIAILALTAAIAWWQTHAPHKPTRGPAKSAAKSTARPPTRPAARPRPKSAARPARGKTKRRR